MSLSLDGVIALLVGMGFSRERAEAEARRQLGIPAPAAAAEPERDASVLEKAEQLECYKIFRAFGAKVRNLSQARASKQAPGLGDAFVCFPGIGFACWWETKRQVGGAHSPAQLEFRTDCEACGIPYETGDRYAAEALVIRLGLAERIGGVLEPTQRSGAA